MDLPLNSTQIAEFLGVRPEFEVPFPRGNVEPSTWSSDGADPGNSNTSKGYRLGDRLPICITGQIRRLELQSKVQRLIQPALKAGHNVEVYLVLDPRFDHTAFVHKLHAPGETIAGNYTITGGSFYSLSETVNIFPSNITVVFDAFIPKDYPVDSRYPKLMNGGSSRAKVYSLKRSKSHMRQWEALDRCWQLILARDPGQVPKMAMRMRDDVAVAEEFVPFVESMPRGIYVPACESWGGLNDKLCIISGAGELQKYFTKPLAMMRHNFSEVMAFQRNRTRNPFNPECALYDTMAMSDVPIFKRGKFFPMRPISILQDIVNPKQKPKMCYVRAGASQGCFSKDLWKRIGLKPENTIAKKYICVPALDPFESEDGGQKGRLQATRGCVGGCHPAPSMNPCRADNFSGRRK
eukprot:Skav209306  [mRNA]  locus=scaffold994:249961:251184:+ [translate_table: standard]